MAGPAQLLSPLWGHEVLRFCQLSALGRKGRPAPVGKVICWPHVGNWQGQDQEELCQLPRGWERVVSSFSCTPVPDETCLLLSFNTSFMGPLPSLPPALVLYSWHRLSLGHCIPLSPHSASAQLSSRGCYLILSDAHFTCSFTHSCGCNVLDALQL